MLGMDHDLAHEAPGSPAADLHERTHQGLVVNLVEGKVAQQMEGRRPVSAAQAHADDALVEDILQAPRLLDFFADQGPEKCREEVARSIILELFVQHFGGLIEHALLLVVVQAHGQGDKIGDLLLQDRHKVLVPLQVGCDDVAGAQHIGVLTGLDKFQVPREHAIELVHQQVELCLLLRYAADVVQHLEDLFLHLRLALFDRGVRPLLGLVPKLVLHDREGSGLRYLLGLPSTVRTTKDTSCCLALGAALGAEVDRVDADTPLHRDILSVVHVIARAGANPLLRDKADLSGSLLWSFASLLSGCTGSFRPRGTASLLLTSRGNRSICLEGHGEAGGYHDAILRLDVPDLQGQRTVPAHLVAVAEAAVGAQAEGVDVAVLQEQQRVVRTRGNLGDLVGAAVQLSQRHAPGLLHQGAVALPEEAQGLPAAPGVEPRVVRERGAVPAAQRELHDLRTLEDAGNHARRWRVDRLAAAQPPVGAHAPRPDVGVLINGATVGLTSSNETHVSPVGSHKWLDESRRALIRRVAIPEPASLAASPSIQQAADRLLFARELGPLRGDQQGVPPTGRERPHRGTSP
mmetsp:Transcript_140863/g.450350  ORF Transcript_140863/g.450350 Transcript_140863/m.450350 type:complete len:576 (+) Transcript_140863:1929-3656(+)